MEPTPERKKTTVGNRVLWIEGHRDNQEMLVVFLNMAGYVVTTCDSIAQAAKVVQDRRFDVYIVGDCLPRGSNVPLAAEIRALNPHAPLILYSALAFADDIKCGLKAGAHAYITKPGQLDHLLATIRGLLTRDEPRPPAVGENSGPHSCRSGSGRSLRGIPIMSEGVPDFQVSRPVVRWALAPASLSHPRPGRDECGAEFPGLFE